MSPFDLTARTILVTGASSGIGRAVAVLAAGLGASVVAVGRRADALERLVTSLPGGGHRREVADLTEEEQRRRLAEGLTRCDGVVHAAGVLTVQPVAYVREKTLRESMSLNYEAPVLLTRLLLRGKRIASGGSVVFVSSIAARRGAMGHAVYSGTKGALEASSRCLALEVAAQRIRVNCVAPGMIRTGMSDEAGRALGDEAMRKHEEEYPLGFGEAQDVASAVTFLLSDGAGWITGTTLRCDGGFGAR